jgi:hypothetical protein
MMKYILVLTILFMPSLSAFAGENKYSDLEADFKNIIKYLPTITISCNEGDLIACDAADSVIRIIKINIHDLSEVEKINNSLSLAMMNGFIEGYESVSK